MTRDEKFKENVNLVHHVLKKFRTTADDYDDLFQVGSMGLLHAVDHFDESKGFKFSTYACNCIRGYVMSYLTKKSRFIKIPERSVGTSNAIGAACESFMHREHKIPTREGLAKELGVSVAMYSSAVSGRIESLDELNEYNSTTVGIVEMDVASVELESLLTHADLTDREREIATLLSQGLSAHLIATRLNLSDSCVSEIVRVHIKPKLSRVLVSA